MTEEGRARAPLRNPVLVAALAVTGGIATWGMMDNEGLAGVSSRVVGAMFASRGWFVMLTVSTILIATIGLALSRYGRVRLGHDDDRPEFSTVSWLTMLFAAGMGVGLLYWGSAEPLTHLEVARRIVGDQKAASAALFVTNFHWGLHAWAIYAMTGLVLAYFGFRRGRPQLISSPIVATFGRRGWTRVLGTACDLLAIVAIAIGLAGSVAMGVFQVQDGVETLLGLDEGGRTLTMGIFVALVLAYLLPLTVDLGKGMALLSNTAMAIAVGLMLYVLLTGPTAFLMSGIVDSLGVYVSSVIPQGFRTYTFLDESVRGWFSDWTLTYMVWWLAWAPFVGVFIARISRGRTIREFVLGVVLVPTVFSVLWFGVFGGIGFFAVLRTEAPILELVANDVSATTFFVLEHLPLAKLTTLATVVAAFLFVVTSVVSAAYVLGMFSSEGDLDPSVKMKLVWGALLGALGLVMILSDSIAAIKSIIALGALPFVYIVLLLMVCLLKALKDEKA
jgi:glycine betaine transporter